jgi:hypothetical protein
LKKGNHRVLTLLTEQVGAQNIHRTAVAGWFAGAHPACIVVLLIDCQRRTELAM